MQLFAFEPTTDKYNKSKSKSKKKNSFDCALSAPFTCLSLPLYPSFTRPGNSLRMRRCRHRWRNCDGFFCCCCLCRLLSRCCAWVLRCITSLYERYVHRTLLFMVCCHCLLLLSLVVLVWCCCWWSAESVTLSIVALSLLRFCCFPFFFVAWCALNSFRICAHLHFFLLFFLVFSYF